MMKSKNHLPELLSAMHFPKPGDTLGTTKVSNAKAHFDSDILKYEVEFPKGTKTKEIPDLLKKFFAMQVVPTHDNLVVRHHDYTVKPRAGKVVVVGAMHIPPVVLANPSIQEFDKDYSKMEMTNPETFFRKHDSAPLNSPQFRAKMFTFPSLMGENYGYGTGKHIFHRRASLIMPKIKITKAVPQAEMMYHTHPRKDEPSLSSPDDYLLYMDLSHKPRGIRHFYTVMADRMDYFTVKPKKDSKGNYVKLDEDKILKEFNDEMDDIEAMWEKKTPKTGDYQDDLRFCENITRDFVKWLNKRYAQYFTITYKCYYKVKKNPPEPEIEDLHLGDEILEKSLDSIKKRDYSWSPAIKVKAHEDYAHWHQMRHLDTLQGSAKTLGIAPQGSMKRAHDRYMNKTFEDTNYSYYDALNILNLGHDIAVRDSKIRDGGGLSSRLQDICSYLELSEEATETLLFLEEVIHNENLFTEEAQTMTGDFHGLALLSSYAIQAIGAIGLVKEGKKEYNIVEYEIYNALKAETQKQFEDFILGEKDARGYSMGENAPVSRGFVDSFLNPPTVTTQRIELQHTFPPEAFAYDFDLVKEALDEFNVEKYEPKRSFVTGRNALNLRFPVTTGKVSMTIQPRTGTAQIFVTRRPDAMEDALDAVTKVGTALVRYGLPGVDPEEYDVQAIDIAQNPQSSQVIAIAGPSGAGKSTTIRNLLTLLPNSNTVPTITTRQKRKSDKPGERIFVSVEQFKKEMSEGKLVAAEMQKNGNYYGRRKSDFERGDYIIIDVNPRGVNAIKRAYPNAFTAYLEPVEDPEFIRKRLLRRGDMSPQEAKARASIIPSHIKSSKNIDFDARVKTKQGEFAKIALELEPLIPKQNPSIRGLVSSIFSPKHPSITWDRTSYGQGGSYSKVDKDFSDYPDYEQPEEDKMIVVDIPVAKLEKLFRKSSTYIPPGDKGLGRLPRIVEAAEKGIPLPVPFGGFVDGTFSFSDGRHRFVYTRDYTNDKTIPIAIYKTDLGQNLMGGTELQARLLWYDPTSIPNPPAQNVDWKIDYWYKDNYYGPKGVSRRDIIKSAVEQTGLPEGASLTKGVELMIRAPKTDDTDNVFLQVSIDNLRLVDKAHGNKQLRLKKWTKSLGIFSSRKQLFGYIEFIKVHEDARNEGFGQAAYLKAAKELGKYGIPILSTNTSKTADRAWTALARNLPPGFKLESITKAPDDLSELESITSLSNPSKKPKTIRIEESPNKEKKLVAYFYDKDGKKFRTVHFGARGMSDFTQHKDPSRKDNYLARHGGMGENWKDPMTAGALSRWILWGKPSLRESFNDFKKRFKLEGVMAVTNTRMNPKAPGYNSYGWTTQDWRSIKVNNKGDIDYSEKCGAEGTKTPSGSPRLCLPAEVVRSLMRTDSGKEVIRKQARKKARAEKGERVPWHPRIKKIWKRVEDKTVKDKPNPPSFISARDPQKWADRYDKIIKMSGDQLMELAEKQAAEKGLRLELEVYDIDYEKATKRRRNFPLPPKYEKLYRKFIESKEFVDILLYRGKTLVDELNFGLITESPKELFDYLESRKRWPKKSAFLPYVANTYKRGRDEPATLRFKEFFTVAAYQNKNRFPISVGGGGGFGMSEGQQGKGYYGIIKTYQAGFLEANKSEAFGDGSTPMRSDLYQSYGWLTAFSYKDNYPYPSRAAEYYLNLHSKSKEANKEAHYQNVYRPVYSSRSNPPEWRHGEFAEEDPFEEYF